MQDHKIRIKLTSPTGTPWQSDTIFGHLCWQVARGVLGIGVEEFLSPFMAGEPPFVLSDAFPAGLLPRPLLGEKTDVAGTPDEYAAKKLWRKAAFYSIDDFLLVCRGAEPRGQPYADPWLAATVPHASLSRVTGTTAEPGGFFESESAFMHDPAELDLYVRSVDGWSEKVMDLLSAVSRVGFGRDKSVGLGAFVVEGMESFNGFQVFNGADGFVSISSMVPSASDPAIARYRLRLKKGKLGEEWIQPNPFKRPLLEMEPGAVFRTGSTIKSFYGRLVRGLSPARPEVVQNCFALAVPCTFS
jgi:CRISPR-associated protein Csm4